MELFQYPNKIMPKAIQNARKFQFKIGKCLEIHWNVYCPKLKFVTFCKDLV